MKKVLRSVLVFLAMNSVASLAAAGSDTCRTSGMYNVYDVDANGSVNKDDAMIILLYLFGFDETGIKNNIGARAVNRDRFMTYLTNMRYFGVLDIDGDGNMDALTDGNILYRYFSGTRGEVLANGVVSSLSRYRTGRELEDRIVANLMRISSLACY